MDPIALRDSFNTLLLNTFAGQMFENSIFSLNGPLMPIILQICFGIALFQCVTKSEGEMLKELAKMAVATWFALGILGSSAASPENYIPFSSMRSQLTAEYQPRGSGKVTIERITFNWIKMKFDGIGDALVESVGGKSALPIALTNMHFLQFKVLAARTMCSAEDTACMSRILTSNQQQIDAEKKDQEKKEEESVLSKVFDSLAKIVNYFAMAYMVLDQITNPYFMFFPLLFWVLQVAQGFINMFVLIMFGISAAITMLLTKVLSPFLIVPTLRDRVTPLFKKMMGLALYGFVMNLVIWISTILVQGLNEATGQFLVKNIAANAGSLAATGDLFVILSSNTFTLVVIMFMQVVAVAKVPKICDQIVNLSFGELANVGQTLLQASFGVSKVLGGIGLSLVPGAGVALAAGAQAASKVGAMVAGGGGGAGGLGAIASKVGGAAQAAGAGGGAGAGAGAAARSAAGAGGPTSYAGSAAPTGGTSNYAPGGPAAVLKTQGATSTAASGGGSGPTLQSSKADEAAAAAKNSQRDAEIATRKSEQARARNQRGIKDGQSERVEQMRVARANNIQDSFDPSAIAGSIGNTFSDMIMDGMGAGLGLGDGTSAMTRGANRAKGKFSKIKTQDAQNDKEVAQFARAESQAMDKYDRDQSRKSSEAAAAAQDEAEIESVRKRYEAPADVGNSAAENAMNYEGIAMSMTAQKKALSQKEEKQFQETLVRASAGDRAAQEQAIRTQNTRNLNAGQQTQMSQAVAASSDFSNTMRQEMAVNSSLMQSTTQGGLTADVARDINQRISAGLMDPAALQSTKTAQGTTVLDEAITQAKAQAQQFSQDLANKQGGYSANEQQQARAILTGFGGAVLGDTAAIANLQKAAPDADASHLSRSANDLILAAQNLSNNFNKAQTQAASDGSSMGTVDQTKALKDVMIAIDAATGKVEAWGSGNDLVKDLSKKSRSQIQDADFKQFVEQIAKDIELISKSPDIQNKLAANTRLQAFIADFKRNQLKD